MRVPVDKRYRSVGGDYCEELDMVPECFRPYVHNFHFTIYNDHASDIGRSVTI
jgi:hypothetical protein